jgi:hypothetical protein
MSPYPPRGVGHKGGAADSRAFADHTAGKPAGYTGRLNHHPQILHDIEPGKAAARTASNKAQPMG